MSEHRTSRVLVILADGFEEIEAITPIDILRRAAYEVVVAGVGSTSITGSHGVTVTTDLTVPEAGTNYDAIVLPGGGKGSHNLAASWDVNEKLLMIANSEAVVAAICAAPAVVLGPAGLLEGHQAVCYPGAESHCPGFSFSHERVCVSGNLITARSAGCAVEFSLAIVEALSGRPARDAIAAAILSQV